MEILSGRLKYKLIGKVSQERNRSWVKQKLSLGEKVYLVAKKEWRKWWTVNSTKKKKPLVEETANLCLHLITGHLLPLNHGEQLCVFSKKYRDRAKINPWTHLQVYSIIHDKFTFVVSTPKQSSEPQTFTISYSPGDTSVDITLESCEVEEGGRKVDFCEFSKKI